MLRLTMVTPYRTDTFNVSDDRIKDMAGVLPRDYLQGWRRSRKVGTIPDRPDLSDMWIAGYLDHACDRPMGCGVLLTPDQCARLGDGAVIEVTAQRNYPNVGCRTYLQLQ